MIKRGGRGALHSSRSSGKPGDGSSPTVTLGTLTLNNTSWTNGTATSGTISGATSGSTLSLTNPPTGFSINSAARTWAFDGTGAAGSSSFTLTETLAGATNTPHANTISYTIASGTINRVLEDGVTNRVLEDGTTIRILG